MKLKRIVALIMALGCIMALSGCGGKAKEDGKKTQVSGVYTQYICYLKGSDFTSGHSNIMSLTNLSSSGLKTVAFTDCWLKEDGLNYKAVAPDGNKWSVSGGGSTISTGSTLSIEGCQLWLGGDFKNKQAFSMDVKVNKIDLNLDGDYNGNLTVVRVN
ncbi:MAG: hypothetical protein IKX10_03260 [Lachnospiraceae bacterium]|nr:hypothetical protein [Lachnospiraceae bacterium]